MFYFCKGAEPGPVQTTIALSRGLSPSERLNCDIQACVKQNTASYQYPRIVELADEPPNPFSGKSRPVEPRKQA